MERFFYQKRRNLSKECTPARPACAGRVFLRLENLVSAGGKGGFDCLSHVDFLLDFAPEPVLCCILSLVFWQARAFTSNEKTGTDSHPPEGAGVSSGFESTGFVRYLRHVLHGSSGSRRAGFGPRCRPESGPA